MCSNSNTPRESGDRRRPDDDDDDQQQTTQQLQSKKQRRHDRFQRKNILASPFHFKWPALDAHNADNVLQMLCSTLSPVGRMARLHEARNTQMLHADAVARTQHQMAQEDAIMSSLDPSTLDLDARIKLQNYKKKKQKKSKAEDKNSNTMEELGEQKKPDVDSNAMEMADGDLFDGKDLQVLSGLFIGINAVTRALEGMIASQRVAKEKDAVTSLSSVRAVFVCKGDLASASHLYAHIPTLTYLAGTNVRLLGLEKGSEASIARALGMSGVIALAIKADSVVFDEIISFLVANVEPPSIPWLPRKISSVEQPLIMPYLPTNIKTLQLASNKNKKKAKRRGHDK